MTESTVTTGSMQSTDPNEAAVLNDVAFLRSRRGLELETAIGKAARAAEWAGGRLRSWADAESYRGETDGARALSELDHAIGQLITVRAQVAVEVGLPWYPAPLTDTIEELAKRIADAHCENLDMADDSNVVPSFDDTVQALITQHGPSFTAPQIATVIMIAREICADESGLMTFTDNSGALVPVPQGGDFTTRDYDLRTAVTLWRHVQDRRVEAVVE